MDKLEVFEFCLHQLLDRYKEKALKEIEVLKNGGPVDEDWPLEDACAADFTRAMVRLGILEETKPKGGGE